MKFSPGQLPIRPHLRTLVVNSMDESYDPTEVQAIIERSESIKSWWNYFPGVWLLESELTSHEVAKLFYDSIPWISCFVCPIETGRFSGKMGTDAWLWVLDLDDERKEKLRKNLEKKQKSPADGQKRIGRGR